jgi:Uncharacterized protein conserved in bacteria
MSGGKSDRPGQPGEGDHSDRDGLEARRRRLETTLAEVRDVRAKAQAPKDGDFGTNYGKAFRLASEFVGGVLVGAVIGWGVDQLLGSSPVGLVVFLMLGFAAGVLAMVRSARAEGKD